MSRACVARNEEQKQMEFWVIGYDLCFILVACVLSQVQRMWFHLPQADVSIDDVLCLL